MGRKNKAYYKDLHQQAYDRLTGMQALGESKKEAMVNGTEKDKIFSFNTYQSYWKHTKYFIKYIKEVHPECTHAILKLDEYDKLLDDVRAARRSAQKAKDDAAISWARQEAAVEARRAAENGQ